MSDKPTITAEMIRESLQRQPELVAMMKRLADDPAAVERAARKHFEMSEAAYLRDAAAVGFTSIKPTAEEWGDLRQSDRDGYIETMVEAMRAAEAQEDTNDTG